MLTWYLGNPSNYQQRRKRNLVRPSSIYNRNKEVPMTNKQHTWSKCKRLHLSQNRNVFFNLSDINNHTICNLKKEIICCLTVYQMLSSVQSAKRNCQKKTWMVSIKLSHPRPNNSIKLSHPNIKTWQSYHVFWTK